MRYYGAHHRNTDQEKVGQGRFLQEVIELLEMREQDGTHILGRKNGQQLVGQGEKGKLVEN